MAAPTNTHTASIPADRSRDTDAKRLHLSGRCADTIDVDFDAGWPRAGGTRARLFHADLALENFDLTTSFTASIRHRQTTQSYACFDVTLVDGLPQAPAVLAVADSVPTLLLLADDLASQPECAATTELLIDPPLDPALVLFDVDGTLVDSLPAYIEVGQLAAQAHGYTLTEQFVRDTMNRNNHEFWELVVPEQTHDRESVLKSLRETSKQHWPRLVEERVRPFAGVAQCLESLASDGRRLGIVTASGGGSMRALSNAGMDHYFDVVVTRHDVATQKPAPDGIIHAMHKLSVNPSDTAYVGDSLVDVQAANAARVDCVALTTGAGCAADLARNGPRRLIDQIETLPGLVRRR